jgi:hypothetical protein
LSRTYWTGTIGGVFALAFDREKGNIWRIKNKLMKKIQLSAFITGLLFLTLASNAQTSWDFQYGFLDVFSTNALQYVVGQTNVTQTAESGGPSDGVSYWCPINNGTPASLTMEFSFPQPTTAIFLKIGSEPVYNFGGGETGTESLWGSKDGTNWIQLVNLPTPTGISADDQLTTNLPSSLIGANQIWIQDRMETSGLNIMAQFLRQDTSSNTNNAFQLNANFAPQLSIFTAIELDFFVSAGQTYQIQSSGNLTNWNNVGSPITGSNQTVQQFFSTRGTNAQFYQLLNITP